MKLAVGGDHAGLPLKEYLIKFLRSSGHVVKDCGTFTEEPVDFPDVALLVCDEIRSGRCERAIMVGGTGVGTAIAGNKFRGVRAALCHDTYCAHQGVEHDDVNVLCLGAWIVGIKLAEELVTSFLRAKFIGTEEFRRRVRKLEELDTLMPKR